jgi:DNA topoisomerase-1
MADAEIEKTTISIDMNNSAVKFQAIGEVVLFDGFLRLYAESTDSDNGEDDHNVIPPLKTGMNLMYNNVTAAEKFTAPPPRYTEASLVRKLEELGIGRPSTYAPTISTIQNRGYVLREDRPGENRDVKIITLSAGKISTVTKSEITGKEKSKLFPQDIGMIVNDFLVENFTHIVDYHFTAEVEEQFDKIAEGNLKWTGMIDKFYHPFHKTVTNTLENKERKTASRMLGAHPETGEPVTVRMGRFGPIAQIGDSENGEKPRFASLAKNQLIETITLEEALNLFRLPRSLGEYEGAEMVVGIGRFGPFVRHNGKFFALKKGVDDPYSITLERALELINEKNESDKKKVIKDFGDIMLLNGRFGPYISKDKKNYKLPKGSEPEKLTKEDCIKIIENSDKTKKNA